MFVTLNKKNVFANNRLRLSVTDNCNFTCSYCTNEGQLHNKGNFIEIETIENLARKIKDENIYIKKINITGGEPCLHRNLLKIVEICAGICDFLTLNTNGSLLNKKQIKYLHDAGIHNIKFGIDSFSNMTTKPCLNNKEHDQQKIIENLFYSIEIMPRSSVNVVISEFNYNSFDELFEFIIDNNINWVEFLELIQYDFRKLSQFPKPGPGYIMLMSKKETHLEDIKYNHSLAKYICTTSNNLTMQFAEDFCFRRVCKNLWTRINSKGEFTPCIKAQEGIPFDANSPIEPQVLNCNNLMCCGSANHLPRNYEGKLLATGSRGEYLVPDSSNKFTFSQTEFDP